MTALHRAGMFFGLLDELASDDRVTDIAVTCEGRVWADRGSGMREHILQVPFRSPQVVRDYAVQLCAQLGRRLDDACPIADASNMHGVRVHAVIAPLVPQGGVDFHTIPRQRGDIVAAACPVGHVSCRLDFGTKRAGEQESRRADYWRYRRGQDHPGKGVACAV